MQDNTQQLDKLLKVFNADRIVSPDEITQVVTAIAKVLANHKVDNQGLTQTVQQQLQQALTWVVDQMSRLQQNIDASHSSHSQQIDQKLADTLKQAAQLISDAKAAMPEDGEDAKPEDVVPLVLAQLKLPEQQKVILDGGEQIVGKINDLPIDDEQLKIDASHVKNLPQTVNQLVRHGGFRNLQVFDESTLITKATQFMKFAGAGVVATVSRDGVVTVTIPGGTGTAADEALTDSGDHTTFTISHTPTANTLLIINQNTGQAVPAAAYSNTTTSITFTSSQQVDDGAGNLVTPTFRARYFY